MDRDCICECKYCIIHKYGVLILNPTGFVIFSIVIYVYWREIKAFFQGRTKYVTPFGSAQGTQQELAPSPSPGDKRDSQQLAPDALESLKGSSSDVLVGQKKIFTTEQIPSPPIKIYVNNPVRRLASPQPQTPTRISYKIAVAPTALMKGVRTPPSPVSPRTPPPPPLPISPPAAATLIEMGGGGGPGPYPEIGTPKSPPQPLPPASQLDRPIKTTSSPADQDPYKLPKTTGEPLKRHESTGSDYFKQMMRGRRPVASISQYAQLKPFKDRKEGGSGKKKHGAAGSKDRKPDDVNKRHHKDKKHNNKKK